MAHINLATTFGVTLSAGAIPDKAERTRSVEVVDAVGIDGEYAKADALKQVKVEVSVSGHGPSDFALVATGTSTDVEVLQITKVERGEANKGRATFSLTASGYDSLGGSGAGGSGGASPDIDTIEIVSVEYACVETLKMSVEAQDSVLTCTDGTAAHRARSKRKGSYDLQGKGDLPSGLGLGVGGASLSDFAGGKVICTSIKESEMAGDWNSWGASGVWYPNAA